MYESKKSSTRKDPYKYQKSSYNRNFHNSTHFNHHKYIKYKQKYNHITPPADPDEELIFQKVFDSKNQQKRHTYKELDEITTTPISKENKFDNKENFSLNSNLDNMKTKMRTNDANVNSDINRGVKESQRKLDEWGNEMRNKFKNVGKECRPNNVFKRAWNGEVGLGKTGNRAAMIGIPVAAAGTALALRKKKKEKEEEEESRKKSK